MRVKNNEILFVCFLQVVWIMVFGRLVWARKETLVVTIMRDVGISRAAVTVLC